MKKFFITRKLEIILEYNNNVIYCDRTIITDKIILSNRSDITLHEKANKIVYLTDIGIPNTQYFKYYM